MAKPPGTVGPQSTTPMAALMQQLTKSNPAMAGFFGPPANQPATLPQLNYNNIIFGTQGGGQMSGIPQRTTFGAPTWDEAQQRRAAMQQGLTQRPEYQRQQQVRQLASEQAAQQAAAQLQQQQQQQQQQPPVWTGIQYWNQEGGG